MFQFLLTQILKLKNAITTQSEKFKHYNNTKTTSSTGVIKILDGHPDAIITVNCSPYIALVYYLNTAWYARIISDSVSFTPVGETSVTYQANVII